MDKKKYYFKQPLDQQDLQVIPDNIEGYIGEALETLEGVSKFVSNAVNVPIENTVPDLNVRVQANSAWNQESVAIANIVKIKYPLTVLDCSVDHLAASTIPSAGNTRYISAFVKYARLEGDPRIDGNGIPLFYDQDDTFVMEVHKGTESGGTPSKVANPDPLIYVLLFEVLLDENSSALIDAVDPENPQTDEIDLTQIVYANSLQRSSDIIGLASANVGKSLIVGASGNKFIYDFPARFSDKAAIFKADGVVGIDCDFNSIVTALATGVRTISWKGSKLYSGDTNASVLAGGVCTIDLTETHNFSNGDMVVVRSLVDASLRFIDSVYPISNVTSTSFDITFQNNDALGWNVAHAGGIDASIALVCHKASGENIATNIKESLLIEGENPLLCTLSKDASEGILFGSVNTKNVTFKNFAIASTNAKFCLNLGTATLEDISFDGMHFNWFKENSWNGGLPSGVVSSSSAANKDRISFLRCNVSGVAGINNTGTQISISSTGGAKTRDLLIQDCEFNKVAGRCVAMLEGCLYTKILRNKFYEQYNRVIEATGVAEIKQFHINDNMFVTGKEEYLELLSAQGLNIETGGGIVSNNTFRRSGLFDWLTTIKLKLLAEDINIIGNTSMDCDDIAFDVGGVNNIIITNNIFINVTNEGININGSPTDCIVKNNVSRLTGNCVTGTGGSGTIIADNITG